MKAIPCYYMMLLNCSTNFLCCFFPLTDGWRLLDAIKLVIEFKETVLKLDVYCYLILVDCLG